jgi:hypothetical protein
LPEGSWVRLAPGTLQEGSDLELARSDRTAQLFVFVTRPYNDGLDAVVEGRRSIVAASASITSFEERRHFLTGQELLPLSLASFRTGAPAAETGLLALSVIRDGTAYEVVGWTGAWDRDEPALRALLESFRLRPPPAAPPPSPQSSRDLAAKERR